MEGGPPLKLLLCFPSADGETGVWIGKALGALGHEVTAVDPRADLPDVDRARERVLASAGGGAFDLILTSREAHLSAIAPDLARAAPLVGWCLDSRRNIFHWRPLFPLIRASRAWFTIAGGNIGELRRTLKKAEIFWLSEGYAEGVHRPVELDEPARRRLSAEVAFAGSLGPYYRSNTDRAQVLEALRGAGLDLKVWGSGEDGVEYLGPQQHNRMVAGAKICLGHTSLADVALSMSARDYRILGAGGFLLTNHVAEIETWLEVGREIETYRTPEECVEKARFYLEHPERRAEIAAAGLAAARARHTLRHRLGTMIEILERCGVL
ncbi:MAG: glycosyltransferase [Planctomycetota bacterium]